MERLVFRRELRAKRRDLAANHQADLGWAPFRLRIRDGERDVLQPGLPMQERMAAMRLQARWRGGLGRRRAREALQALASQVSQFDSKLDSLPPSARKTKLRANTYPKGAGKGKAAEQAQMQVAPPPMGGGPAPGAPAGYPA